VTDIRQASDQLHQWIDAMVELAEKRFGEGKRDQALSRALTDDLWAYSDDLVKRHRGRALDADEREFLALDINLNAMGLAVYIQKASS
jgi:hypothetical protein